MESKSRLDAIYMRGTKETTVTKNSVLYVNSGYWHLSNTELLKKGKNVDQQLFGFIETALFIKAKLSSICWCIGHNDIISVVLKRVMMICIESLKKKSGRLDFYEVLIGCGLVLV